MTLGTVFAETFKIGGPGFAMFSILAIGFFSWLITMFLKAINRAHMANFADSVATFAVIGILVGIAYTTITMLFKFTQ